MGGQDSAKQEGWTEDQKPCGGCGGHVSIFHGVQRILSAGQKQMLLTRDHFIRPGL